MPLPNISRGQIAIDPTNGLLYYKNSSGILLSATLNWMQVEGSNSINTNNSVTIDQNLIVTGNLTVNGTTVTLNTETVTVEDNVLILNSTATGSPTMDAGIEVERGDELNVSVRWNESIDKWELTNNGIDYIEIKSGNQDISTDSDVQFNSVTSTFIGDLIGNIQGDLTGTVTGQVSDLSNHGINSLNDVNATPNNNEFLKWNGTAWVNDLIDLKTDTVGDYVQNLIAGTGVSISENSGEAATPTISIGQSVGITNDVIFNQVTADLIGDVIGTVSDISNHGISDLSDVVINDANNGDFLRYNGANWINDPVNLTTDTVGDYVATVTSGLGISVTPNIGEGATPSIALDAVLDNLNDVIISDATPGQILQFDGNNWVNTVNATMEPIGFENKADSVISFNKTSREFSISPASTSYSVWCVGKKFTKTITETIQIPNNPALHFIFFDSEGRLGTRQSYFNWDSEAPVSYVYWNADDQEAYFFADERHGIVLDWATHEYLHRTRGAAIANGFGVNNFTITGLGASNADAQIDIANGTFFDEDLQVDITHSTSPTLNTWQQRLQGGAYIPVFYRLNNHWKKDTATQFPLKQGTSRPQYNLNSGGTWSSVDVGNNRFAISWIIATNNLNEPIIAVLGQNTYGDKGSAEADFYGSLDLDGFPIVEFRPLYKIVYECKDSYTNTPHAAFRTVSDLRSIISADQGVSAVAVSDHGSLTGLQDDDHPQYLLEDGTRTAQNLTVSGSISASQLTIDGIEIDPSNPTDTNVLKYVASLNKYIPGVASTVASLDDLTDVIITSATPNQILKFDGTNWINGQSPSTVEGTTFITTIGDGVSESFTITHYLATRDVVVVTRESSYPYTTFLTNWEPTTTNTIDLHFEHPPAVNSVRVAIYAAVSGVITAFGTLNDVEDVELDSIEEGQILVYDGEKWVNSGSAIGIAASNAYSETIGDGSATSFIINHLLGSRDVIVQARDASSPYQSLNIVWEATTINDVTVYFDSPPSLNSVRIKIIA
jgi:hypothetical protein